MHNKVTRSILLSALSLLWAINLFSQAEEVSGKQDNLYSVALAASMDQMEKSWGRIDDCDHGSRMRTDYRRMLIKKDPEITDDLPSQFGDHYVEFLDDQELIGKIQDAAQRVPCPRNGFPAQQWTAIENPSLRVLGRPS